MQQKKLLRKQKKKKKKNQKNIQSGNPQANTQNPFFTQFTAERIQ
jgi:hypothetical protein